MARKVPLKCARLSFGLLHLPQLPLPRIPTYFTWKIPLYPLRLSSGISSSVSNALSKPDVWTRAEILQC